LPKFGIEQVDDIVLAVVARGFLSNDRESGCVFNAINTIELPKC